MNRLRLFAASLIGRIVRPLLRASARLLAGLPQPAPVVPEAGTEPANTLVPAPTVEEVVRSLERFSNERAPEHPPEAVFFALYIQRMSTALAPFLALLTESQPTPPAPPKDDAAN